MQMAGLQKALSLYHLCFYGVGVILGAGIYSVIGPAAGLAEYGVWLSFALAAIAVLFTALSYAELATMIPDAGAEFAYLKKALPGRPEISFVMGLLVIFTNAATAATVALTFAGYLNVFIKSSLFTGAVLLLVFAAAVNIFGIKKSSFFNILFTFIEGVGLVLVIYFAVTATDNFGKNMEFFPTAGIFQGAALIIFSFLGFENIANLSEEAKNPGRDLPRAILMSLALVTVIYILVGLSAVSLLPPEQLAQSSAPLSDVLRVISQRLAKILGFFALFATANTALISVLSGSRILFSMARAREIPKYLARISKKKQTPWLAILVILAIAIITCLPGELEFAANLTSFSSLLAFLSVNIAVLLLRKRQPKMKRPFRSPGSIKNIPVFPCLGIATNLFLLTQFRFSFWLYGIALMALFLMIYYVSRYFTMRS